MEEKGAIRRIIRKWILLLAIFIKGIALLRPKRNKTRDCESVESVLFWTGFRSRFWKY